MNWNEKILRTNCGLVRGLQAEGQEKYLGIRYATAGRWEYPTEVTGWEGVYDATHYGDACMQLRALREEDKNAFYYKEFRQGETYHYSEDCFYLNIWKPADCVKAPVIFYIHGGAFQGGCGHEKHFDGKKYAERGIIFVTCNYRLGPFGFCAMPELAERDGFTGNYGLFDQLTAFHWVRHNIECFGGDPDNITLMGQSAGAMSIQQLCASPLARDEIARVIMTSGGGISDAFGTYIPAEQAYPFWKDVTSRLGGGLDDWCKADARTLLTTMMETARQYENAIQYFSPVLDGRLICCDAQSVLRDGRQAKVPYLMGTTKDDMQPDVLARMAREWTVLQSEQGKCPSYCFWFGRNLPGDDQGAWHSSELWYTIGMLENSWRPMTEWDHAISDRFLSYFSNFAATGDPNGGTLPVWQPTTTMDDPIMVIDDRKFEMERHPLQPIS